MQSISAAIDRLTRSLADFAKLIELFDAHGVSL
jgi:DNA invertase Pin-like site-specific DNA recombinase